MGELFAFKLSKTKIAGLTTGIANFYDGKIHPAAEWTKKYTNE
jgi:hypothetical protein